MPYGSTYNNVNGSTLILFEGAFLATNYLYVMYTTAAECAEMITGEIPLSVIQTGTIWY